MGNGIHDNGGGDVRPERIKNQKGKCAAEYADHPGFVKVEFEHAKLKQRQFMKALGMRSIG